MVGPITTAATATAPATAVAGGRAVAQPTIWGLTPVQLHDRFWAARGIQVVRQGEASEIVEHAELFLLTDPRTLTLFKSTRIVEHLAWVKPDVVWVRLHDDRERGYGERIVSDSSDRFVRFERIYGGSDSRLARVALTPDRRLAQLWQKAPDVRAGWRGLREETARAHRSIMSLDGKVYDRDRDAEVMQFVRAAVAGWKSPDATIPRVRPASDSVWRDESSVIDQSSTLIGPVWIGAGRRIEAKKSIVGPTILWDDPSSRPKVERLEWLEIEPSLNFERPIKPHGRTGLSLALKRAFDIVFSLAALLLTLPLYPLILLAIWLEDGRPFFFAHKRETLGGRQFGCLKFRSMRKNADAIQRQLAARNAADGPQFFIENDPRITRVGHFLRKTNLDELPQFLNVLLGHMSVVGPRPSPFHENQFCPAWREARLSVRPGLTGLWQVRRTRRQGLDFQEWIKFDIEYVENMSWRLDFRIIAETIRLLARGILRS